MERDCKMNNKTCGECKHFEPQEYFCCTHGFDVTKNSTACALNVATSGKITISLGKRKTLQKYKNERMGIDEQ
jgi:hypothetical protein